MRVAPPGTSREKHPLRANSLSLSEGRMSDSPALHRINFSAVSLQMPRLLERLAGGHQLLVFPRGDDFDRPQFVGT